ncbi:MAG: PAS domain-containing protein [Chloroflexi bacterium]|nr:PAS domain-containing protein [Chloroflexota bacterium]
MSQSLEVILLGITALFTSLLAARIWGLRRSAVAASTAMVALLVAVVWWTTNYMIEVTASDTIIWMLAYRLKFLGVVLVPVAWLAFSAGYIGRKDIITRKALAILLIMPFVTTAMIWTNDLHHLMWDRIELTVTAGQVASYTELGTWFWAHSVYSYILIMVGTGLLLRQFMSAPSAHRRQLLALFVAVAAPLIANALTIFGNLQLDLTPFAFAITGTALTWGLLRYHLLDIVPVARNLVIDSLPDAVFVLDLQGRLVDINPAGSSLIGDAAANVIGRRFVELAPMVKEQPELVDRYRTNEPLQDVVQTTRGGATIHYELRMSPLRSERSELIGRVITLRDISESKRIESEIQARNTALVKANADLAEAREIAEAATQLKNQFLANMSHELRTPLNAIIGYTEIQLAGMTGDLNEEQTRYQERVLANAEQLLGLINDVLDIAKIEAGRMNLIRKPFIVRSWFKSIFDKNRVLAEAKALNFALEIDDQLPEVLVEDSARLGQVITNLVSNAVKFTQSGGVTITVKSRQHKHWEFAVSDTGIGIPLHAHETIFEEFRQVDGSSSRQYGGTGLGLTIVRRIVMMMGGTITLQSAPEVGSTFTVALPMIDVTDNLDDVAAVRVMSAEA